MGYKKSDLWDSEDNERKEYIAEWFEEVLNLNADNINEMQEKILDLEQRGADTPKEQDLLNYINGEKWKNKIIDGVTEILENKVSYKVEREQEYKQEISREKIIKEISETDYKYNGRYYKSDVKEKNNINVVYEKQITKKGQYQERIRDIKTGRFIKK